MPKSKQTRNPRSPKAPRSLEEIEQVFEHGWGIQRMCGCQPGDPGPCSPDHPAHEDIDFGPALTNEELEALHKDKQQRFIKAEFDSTLNEVKKAIAEHNWAEFRARYNEHKEDKKKAEEALGRDRSRKTVQARQDALVERLVKDFENWLSEHEKEREKLQKKRFSARKITMALCGHTNERNKAFEDMQYSWTDKGEKEARTAWSLYPIVKENLALFDKCRSAQ